MLACVASVNYHPPGLGYTIPGVAVRIGKFIGLLDEQGIIHCTVEKIRKEIKSCRLAVTSTKQFFVRDDCIGKPPQRNYQHCRGCAVIPNGVVPLEFIEIFESKH